MANWTDLLRHNFYDAKDVSQEQFLSYLRDVAAEVVGALAVYQKTAEHTLIRGSEGYILPVDDGRQFEKIMEIRVRENQKRYAIGIQDLVRDFTFQSNGNALWRPRDEIYDAYNNTKVFVIYAQTLSLRDNGGNLVALPDEVERRLGRVISLGAMSRLTPSQQNGVDYKKEFMQRIEGIHAELSGGVVYREGTDSGVFRIDWEQTPNWWQ